MEYVQETGDLIRYTQIVPHDRMAAMTSKTIALLKAKGYVLEKVDNKYLNPKGRYKAIHLDIVNAQGVHFEMQIHSQQTLAAILMNLSNKNEVSRGPEFASGWNCTVNTGLP